MPEELTITKSGTAIDMLAQIGRGATLADIEDGAKECALSAQETGKKSKLIIELTFDPDSKTDAMRVSSKVKTRLPEQPQKAALFFVTPEGKLTRQDPRQVQMFPGKEESYDPTTGEIRNP